MAKLFSKISPVGVFVLIISLVFLCYYIARYFMVFDEYQDVKSGTCTTVTSYYTGDRIFCTCGNRCSARHDCLVIKVILDHSHNATETFYRYNGTIMLNPSRTDNVLSTNENSVILYEDEEAVYKQTCTYHPRCTWESTMQHRIEEYNSTYGKPGVFFECHFHQDHPDKVMRVTADTSKFVYFFLWPSLGVVLGVIIMVSPRFVDYSSVKNKLRDRCKSCTLPCRRTKDAKITGSRETSDSVSTEDYIQRMEIYHSNSSINTNPSKSVTLCDKREKGAVNFGVSTSI